MYVRDQSRVLLLIEKLCFRFIQMYEIQLAGSMREKKKHSTNYSFNKIIIGRSRGSLKITEKKWKLSAYSPVYPHHHYPSSLKISVMGTQQFQAMSSKRKKDIDLSSEVRQEWKHVAVPSVTFKYWKQPGNGRRQGSSVMGTTQGWSLEELITSVGPDVKQRLIGK